MLPSMGPHPLSQPYLAPPLYPYSEQSYLSPPPFLPPQTISNFRDCPRGIPDFEKVHVCRRLLLDLRVATPRE